MKSKIIIGLIIVIIGAGVWWYFTNHRQAETTTYRTIMPTYNDIRTVISTTGTVEPQNRLEIKPQINGRIEKMLVNEGDHVKKGDILVWMSSTDRAALLDAARTQGKEALTYWENVYKPTPLISPINGEVIVRQLEPGQTINVDTPVVVLSDYLIIKAQVDETDIGRVKLGQPVEISLDAYPDKTFKGKVSHIAYESTLVNNVIIYEVDILPLAAPGYFRSGMGANVTIIDKEHPHTLTLPLDAIAKNKQNEDYVLVSNGNTAEAQPSRQKITIGLTDDKQAEILTGITSTTAVLVKSQNYKIPNKSSGSNPFMPSRRTSSNASGGRGR